MVLFPEDMGADYELVDSGFTIVDGTPIRGDATGWDVRYSARYEAIDFSSNTIDAVSSTLESYRERNTLRRNLRIEYFQGADEFDVDAGEEAVGYQTLQGVEGSFEHRFVIRFIFEPVIATITVEGGDDLDPTEGREAAVNYARRVDERIASSIEADATTTPP